MKQGSYIDIVKDLTDRALWEVKNITTISIDSTKPFAEVIPSNCGRVTLFDVDGNEVPINE